MKKNGKYLTLDHIYAVFNREKKHSLFGTDLRHCHLDLDSLIEMRVKLAVLTLSSKVAADMSKFENDATSSTQEYIFNVKNSGRCLMTQKHSEMKMMQEF